jgi:hypothetical protein
MMIDVTFTTFLDLDTIAEMNRAATGMADETARLFC